MNNENLLGVCIFFIYQSGYLCILHTLFYTLIFFYLIIHLETMSYHVMHFYFFFFEECSFPLDNVAIIDLTSC